MQFDSLREAYLDWVNNYSTIGFYAECNGLTIKQAVTLLQLGCDCHESYCLMMKEES